MNVVAELVADWLGKQLVSPVTNYHSALRSACEAFPPPFGEKYYGDIYRGVAGYPEWLASSLLVNAAGEADGSSRLWELACFTPDTKVSEQIKQHSIDEARHSRWYLAILDLTFPGCTETNFRTQLETLSPGYTLTSAPSTNRSSPYAHPVTVDDLIQMNIAEIRTCIHHLLQRPMLLVHCSPRRHRQLLCLLDSLLSDEIRHIAYTATLIEASAISGHSRTINELMQIRLNDFNAITRDEVGRNAYQST